MGGPNPLSVDVAPLPTPTLALALGTAVLAVCGGTLAVLGLHAVWTDLRRPAAERLEVARRWALGGLGVLLASTLAPATPEMRWRLGFAYDPAPLVTLLTGDRPPMGIEDVQKYGLAWPLAVRAAVTVWGPDPDVPFLLTPWIHGLGVLAAAQLARALGATAVGSAWVAFAFATSPLLVWFGHTDGPFPADALFGLLTLGATARYANTHRMRDLVVASCAMVVAAQCRVESVTTGVFAVLLAVAMADRFPWRSPLPYVAAALTTSLLVPHAMLVHDQVWREASGRYATDEPTRQVWTANRWLFTNATMQAWVWIALWPVGAVLGGLAARRRLWAFGVMVAAASTVSDILPLQTSFSVARYQLRSLPFAALLGGLGAAWVASGRRALWGGLAVVLAAVAGLRGARTASVLRTEYAFFEDHLGEVPRGCTVMTWRSQPDTTLFVPLHLSRLLGLGHRWLDIAHDAVPATGCVWYYRSGGCSQHYRAGEAGERHPVCTSFEAAWTGRAVAEQALTSDPYGPMGIENQRPGTPIPVGFYELRPGP
ncbi:MAG: hypothetical protein RLZZ383_1423 [Pseudomonadota bacterium]